MSDSVIIAIIGTLGGAGGIFTLIKAILDHRANKSAKEQDAEERLVTRLETRLNAQEARIKELEHLREEDGRHIYFLALALARAGIDVPDRPTIPKKE